MIKKINQKAIGLVLSYSSIFISSLVGIFFTPYMIMKMGDVEYGLYQLLYAAIGYVALLDFGLGSTLTRYIIKLKSEKNEEKLNSAVSISLKIYCFISLLVVLVVTVLSFNLDAIFQGTINSENIGYSRELFLLMGITTAVSLISHALSGIQTAEERFFVVKGVYLIRQVARVVIAYVLLSLNMGAMAVVLTDLVITVALLLFDILYCKIRLKVVFFKGKWDGALAKGLFAFSFYTFLQIIINQTNISLNRVLLGVFSTLENVALYGVIMQLCSMFRSMCNVVSSVTFPQISRFVFSGADRKSLSDYCAKYSRYQLFISAPLLGGFILFGKMFVDLWVPSYNNSYIWICTLFIVVPEMIEAFEGTIFHVMKAKNMQKTRSLILIGVLVANIFFTILFIKINPIFGPAWASSLSFILGNLILSNIYYHKKVGVDMFRYFGSLFKGVAPAWVVSLLLGYGIALTGINGWIGFIIKCGLYVVVYCASIYLIGLNKEEKQIVSSIIFKVTKRKQKAD